MMGRLGYQALAIVGFFCVGVHGRRGGANKLYVL